MAFLMKALGEKAKALSEQVFDDFGMIHAGEALVEAKVAIGKALMVDTEGLEHGSIEVIYMHRVF